MATKVTHTVSDTESDHHPSAGTPLSSPSTRHKPQRRSSSPTSDESDSSFAADQEGVPLKQLSKKKTKSRKLRPGFRPESQGNENGSEENVLYNRRSLEDGDEGGLVVRWSQDGGSPRSLNKLREKHRRRTGRRRRGNAGYRDDGDEDRIPGDILFTLDEERKVVRKMDKYLVGFLAGLYMLSFLDRSSKCPLSFCYWNHESSPVPYATSFSSPCLLLEPMQTVPQALNVDRIPNQTVHADKWCDALRYRECEKPKPS